MKQNLKTLIEKANKIFLNNFPAKTKFERALFFSWHCDLRDCAFCYMSTITPKENNKPAIRSMESLIAEAIICKKMGWDMILSGGIGAYTSNGFFEMLKNVSKAYGSKIWLNVGALSEEQLIQYKPYICGVIGSIETVDTTLHDKLCPSKPMEPYFKMFNHAEKHGINRAMTLILGLGEAIEDFEKLKNIIKKYNINKIHMYSLNPHSGTIFENSKTPSDEYQAEWIAKTRISFPTIQIVSGIWLDRVDRVALLLKAGTNVISKFPSIRKFNSNEAKEIEIQAKIAEREFEGTLTNYEFFNIDLEIENLSCNNEMKKKIKEKLSNYESVMVRN